jgi:hypothetical protein
MPNPFTAIIPALVFVGTMFPLARGNPATPVVRQGVGVDQFLSSQGNLFAAANFGTGSEVIRNGITFSAAGAVASPSGTNWSAVASMVNPDLEGNSAIDPLFFRKSRLADQSP